MLRDSVSTLQGNVRWVNNRSKHLRWEIVSVGIGQSIVAIGAMVGVRLLTGFVSPTVYGEVALAMTILTLFNQVMLGPISNATMRFFAPAVESGELYAYMQACYALLVKLAALLFSIAVIAVLSLMVLGNTDWLKLGMLTFVFAVVSGLGSVLNSMQNAARQRIVVAWHNGLGVWLRYSAAIVFVSFLGASSTSVMGGYVFAALLIVGSQIWFFRRRILPQTSADSVYSAGLPDAWYQKMRKYALPFSTWGVFTWLQLSSDRWALAFFQTRSDVGLYAVLYQLGYYPLLLISGFGMQLIAPILFGRAGDGLNPIRLRNAVSMNQKLVAGVVILSVLGALLAASFHQVIFGMFAGVQYQEMSYLYPLIVLSGGLFAAGQLASLSFQMSADTKSMISPKIGSAIFGIAASVVGAYFWGVMGVAVASLSFSIVYLSWIAGLVMWRDRTTVNG